MLKREENCWSDVFGQVKADELSCTSRDGEVGFR